MTPNQPPPAAVDPLLGRVLDGRYRIEAFVARGGMATIYRGADLRLDRTVAIKVMHPSFASDPGFVDRFEREARAAARLNSQYVVAVHDQGNDVGAAYLIMEFVPGHTVRDVLRTHGALQPAQALAIIDPVLEALAAAHRAGYVHRDVKPENVLISDDGRVKVTDFGLARAIEGADSGKTHGLLLGTVAYLSPEQVEHDHTDARSDVYSAGILLFELVTGQVPFSAAAPMQVAYKHVHEDVPAPSKVHPGIPAGIDAAVLRATRRIPDQRFPDAAAFLAEVRALRATLPPAQPWSPSPYDTLVVVAPAKAADPEGAATAGPAGGAGTGSGPAEAGSVAAAGTVAAAGVAAAGVGAVAGGSAAEAPGGDLDAPDWVNRQGPAPTIPPSAPTPPADERGEPGRPTDSEGHADQSDGGHATEVSHHTAQDGAGRPRRGRKAIWLGLVALISLIGVLAVVLTQQVSVPNVLGRTPTEAAAVLATANLKLDAKQTGFSEDIAKGLIVSTDPAPDSSTWSGRTVRATVSKGPERYEVPNLKKTTLKEAQVALAAVNLELGTVTEAYDDKIKKGQIVSSNPPAGESVKRSTKVDVTVSRGPEPVTLPAVTGTDGDAAEKTLTDLGLTVDRKNKYDETVAKGLVISMDPPDGTAALRGDTVTLVVSKGPPLVEVPNVVGRSEADARSILQGAGFQVTVNKPLGTSVFGVNSQSPGGGTQAPKGSTVTVTVV